MSEATHMLMSKDVPWSPTEEPEEPDRDALWPHPPENTDDGLAHPLACAAKPSYSTFQKSRHEGS